MSNFQNQSDLAEVNVQQDTMKNTYSLGFASQKWTNFHDLDIRRLTCVQYFILQSEHITQMVVNIKIMLNSNTFLGKLTV